MNDLKFRLLNDLLPQIVIGHRLWATAANKKERFIRAEKIEFLHDTNAKEMWTVIDFKRSDVKALKIKTQKFIDYAGLGGFSEILPADVSEDGPAYLKKIIRLEQKHPQKYVDVPIEKLHLLPKIIGNKMWCIMRTVPAYRRYYFWASKELTNGKLLDPLLSVYVVIYYLGSVTRYRPNYFEDLQASSFGNLFDEIIQTQGQQMLFHLAAEFQERDISWPAVL